MLRTRKNKKEVEEEARLVIISRVLHLCAESERDRGIECYRLNKGKLGRLITSLWGWDLFLTANRFLRVAAPSSRTNYEGT